MRESSAARWTELEAIVRDASVALGGAAISIVAVDRSGISFEHTAGHRDVRRSELADAGCVFGAASITKVVTALAVMRDVEAGRLALEDRIVDRLAAFAPIDPRMRAITIAMLLSHTSGLCGFDPYTWHLEPDNGSAALESSARVAAKSLLVADPGAAFHYGEHGYDVLGALLEHIGDASFEEIAARRVLGPLAMWDTAMKPREGDRRAWPHALDARGSLRATDVVPHNRAHAPCGAMQTTPRDLGALARALLGNSPNCISHASLRLMSTTRAETRRPVTPAIGLGLFLRERDGDLVVGHGGLDIGYRCGISAIPARGVGIAVMTNAMWGPVMDLCDAGLDAAIGRAPRNAIPPRASWGTFAGRFATDDLAGGEKLEAIVELDDAGLSIVREGRRSRLSPLSADSFVCLADDDALNRSLVVVSRDRLDCAGIFLHRL